MPTLDIQSLQALASTASKEVQKGLGAVFRAQDDINRRIKQLFTAEASSGGGLSDDSPLDIGTTSAGTDDLASRSDHVHAHGNQLGGSLHAVAVAGVSAGFISAASQTRLDGTLSHGQILAISRGWPLP